MPGDACFAELSDEPFACRGGVAERFERVGEFDSVHVRDAVQSDRTIAVAAHGFGCHDDAKVRAADADVYDIGETTALEAPDAALVHASHEFAHFLELATHLGHDVDAIGHFGASSAACASSTFQVARSVRSFILAV
jgi:hypothetical protein